MVKVYMALFPKPHRVEAMRYTGNNYCDISDWSQGNFRQKPVGEILLESSARAVDKETYPKASSAQVYNKAEEFWVNVVAGDWIICEGAGEYFRCDSETFKWKYGDA